MSLFDFFKKKETGTQIINTIIVQDNTSGSSGTEVFGGSYAEEYLIKLRGPERAKEFAKVREDYQSTMLLGAVKNPILGASREVRAASDDKEHMKHKALIDQNLFTDIDLDQLIYEALLCCDYGYSLFEESFEVKKEKVVDEEGNTVMPSYMAMKQPEWRDPKTIYYWNFDKVTKKLMTVTQQAYGDLGGTVNLDAEFLNIITVRKEGQNFEGRSLLRPCYGPYLRKNTYVKLNAVNIEKSQPIPTAEVPAGKENSEEFNTLKLALSRFTSHQCNYLISPVGWNVKLSNGTAYDPSKLEVSIDNEDKRMAMAFAANFLMLGTSGKGGSYSLSNDLSDFFLSGLLYISGLVEKSINSYIKKIIIVNFGKQAKYPTFHFTGIDDKAGEELATMVEKLINSGAIIPDDKLEESLRKRTGLPPVSEDGRRETKEDEFEKAPKTLSERVTLALKKRGEI